MTLPGAVSLLDALPCRGWVESEDGRRDGGFEGGLEPVPDVLRVEGVEVREGGEGAGEDVARLIDGVGLDAHEDRETVERGGDALGGWFFGGLRGNEALDDLRVRGRPAAKRSDAVEERAGTLVCVFVGGVDGEPVREVGHVERGDAEDVQEALRAPGLEVDLEVLEGLGVVQAQDGVRDVELVLWGPEGVSEVRGGEVPVKVREGLGEEECVLTRGGDGGVAGGVVELEQLVDAAVVLLVEAVARLGEGLEPREVARVCGWVRREGLGVGGDGGVIVMMAGLREELGVLLEDLQVLLFFLGVCVSN